MSKIRWGVLGTGNIVSKAGRGLQQSQHGVWHGVAGRTLENGKAAAEKYGVPCAYGSYRELIEDPQIDAVYIALLNHLHMEWAIEACKAGKHVLVEKPFTLNAAETAKVKEAAARYGVRAAEAFVWRFHPAYAALMDMIEGGRIGTVEQFFGHFSFVAGPSSTRWKKEWGGGALYDIGCYPVAWSRFFMAAEPEAVDASAEWDPVEQVDRRFTGTLYYPGGRTALVSCAFDMGLGSFFELLGTKGRMSVRTAVTQETMTIAVTTNVQGADDTQEWTMNRPMMFADQADSFVELFREGTPQPNHIEDALAQARVMDAIFEAARTGRRVHVVK